ncbi:MAG TPA: YCF48-related protein [Bacteroidia bacterium]|nr:YCF48-related protein [Bacteroidia bacterium]
MKKYFLSALLLFSIAANAQQNFNRTCSVENFLSQSPQANPLRAVAFATHDTVFAVGDNGNIIQSFNGGNNWTLQPRVSYYAYYDVKFPAKDTGYVGGQSNNYGCVLKTVDRGQTWTPLFYGSLAHGSIYSLWFTNANVGYAGSGGTVFRTVNGGSTWTGATVGSGSVSDIYFVNADTGFCTNVNKIYRTVNAGVSWTQIYNNASENLDAIWFTTKDTGYFGALSGKVFKTTNGGTTWTLNYTVSGAARKIRFLDTQTGFVSGSNGYVYKTINGGTSWTSTFLISSDDYYGMGFDQSRGVVVSRYGNIMLTNDLATYVNKKTGLNLSFYSMDMINHQIGYFGGTGASVYKTTDGGATFTSQTTGGYDQYIMRMSFPNKDTGYINGWKIITTGNNPIFKRTFNGGTTWTTDPPYGSTIGGQFSDIFFITGKFGFMCQGKNVLRTVDAGNSWTITQAGDTNRLWNIYFLNKDTGWVCGNNGKIVRTIDGGLTWTQFTIATTDDFQTITFKDGLHGFAGSSNGTMYKTSDAGQTWTLAINYGTPYIFYDIQFANQQVGFFRLWDNLFGEIFKTFDGGQTWRVYDYEYFNYNFTGMEYTGPGDTLDVIGYNGIIMQLYDKYPQPPVTSYNVCDSGAVSITVPVSNQNIAFYNLMNDAWTTHLGVPYNYGMLTSTDTVYYSIADSMAACESRRSPVYLNVIPSPIAPTISPSADTTICAGTPLTLSVPCVYNFYLWSNGATTCSIPVSTSGNYSVMVSNSSCGSNSVDTVSVNIVPLPATPVINFATSDSITADVAGTYYYWYFNGVLQTDTTQTIVVNGQAGDYTVVVENSNGCLSDTSQPFVLTDVHELNVNVSMWPNPASDELHFVSAQKIEKVEMVNVLGEVILSVERVNSNVNVKGIPEGIYLVKMTFEDGSNSAKEVVVRGE